eukprot:scaffold26828_cov33-Prasinocladus_malaysianus.AAC.1
MPPGGPNHMSLPIDEEDAHSQQEDHTGCPHQDALPGAVGIGHGPKEDPQYTVIASRKVTALPRRKSKPYIHLKRSYE